MITKSFSPNDLRKLREVSKNWCHIITPNAFRNIRMKTTLKGAYGLYEILQIKQLYGHIIRLELELFVDETIDKKGVWVV
jgi:hypothetical protein